MKTTLTEIEAMGLKSKYNFADGHAYHELNSFEGIIHSLPDLWKKAASNSVYDQECSYRMAFSELASHPSVAEYPHFKICPTASNSIDILAAWCRQHKLKVGLLEPTFDNLHLLLMRREVEVVSIDEDHLYEDIKTALKNADVDAVFLVNPNNPTGRNLNKLQFCEVVEFCKAAGIVVLLDNTFRFFVEQTYDQYQILLDSNVSFISIEDTGKVWPTLDMKASLIFYSQDIKKDMDIIYDEIYLCVSPFTLAVLEEFLKLTHQIGLKKTVWDVVSKRRQMLRDVLVGTALGIDPKSLDSRLSVEWVKINSVFSSDLELGQYFKQRDLIILPGRNFYWNDGCNASTMNIRFSLLKPLDQFQAALEMLKSGLNEVRTA